MGAFALPSTWGGNLVAVAGASHDNPPMDANELLVPVPDVPNARAVRRFWTAWLIALLVMLAALIVIFLVAAVVAEPARISPAG